MRFRRGLGTDKSLLQVGGNDAGQSIGIAGMSSTLFIIPQTCRNSPGLCNDFQEISCFQFLELSFPGLSFCQRCVVVERMSLILTLLRWGFELRYKVCDREREETFLNCFFFLLKSLQIWAENWMQLPILMIRCFSVS